MVFENFDPLYMPLLIIKVLTDFCTSFFGLKENEQFLCGFESYSFAKHSVVEAPVLVDMEEHESAVHGASLERVMLVH